METANERTDWVYLVVTVLKTKNTYRLRKFKPKLAPNEFCYAFKVSIDKNEWFNRLEEVELEKVSPPEILQPKTLLRLKGELSAPPKMPITRGMFDRKT